MTPETIDRVVHALSSPIEAAPWKRTPDQEELLRLYLNAPSAVFSDGTEAAVHHARVQWLTALLTEEER